MIFMGRFPFGRRSKRTSGLRRSSTERGLSKNPRPRAGDAFCTLRETRNMVVYKYGGGAALFVHYGPCNVRAVAITQTAQKRIWLLE